MEQKIGVAATEATGGGELIVRCDGSMQLQSNFDQWRKFSLQVIAGFNLKPETAEECGQAKEDAKACKAAEDAIEKAIAEILAQNAEINRIITGASDIKGEFAFARTTMTKAVDAYAAKQKDTIFNEFWEKIRKAGAGSPVAHAVQVDLSALRSAMKGKSAEPSIRKALEEEADRQIAKLRDVETLYEANMEIIRDADAVCPGIAPDRKQLALKNPDVVEEILEARKLQVEAARIKKEAAERAALIEKEALELASKTQPQAQVVPAQEEAPAFAELPPMEAGAADDEPPPFAELQPMQAEKAPGCHIVLDLDCDQAVAAPLVQYLSTLKHVVSVRFAGPTGESAA